MRIAVTAVVLALAGCTSSQTPPPITVTATPPSPSPEAQFLAAMHQAAVPDTDEHLMKAARGNCSVLGKDAKHTTASQIDLAQVGTGFTRKQAEVFVTEGQKAFCPEKLEK